MKKNFKFLVFSLTLILSMSLLFGCTEDVKEPDNDIVDVKSPSKLSVGFLNEKYVEDDKMMIEIGYVRGENESFTGNLKLQLTDDTIFDSLEPLELYIVAYDENNNLTSIEKNTIIKDYLLEGQKEPEQTEVVVIKESEKVDTTGLSLLDSYSLNIFGDQEDETISMYTDAEKDNEGNIMWDDGQTWKLIVHGEDKDFVLFDDYLQLASIDFFIYTLDEDFYLSTVNSGTANLTVKEYKFNKIDQAFESRVKSNTSGNVNMLYKSNLED